MSLLDDMLTEDEFWVVIEKSLRRSSDMEEQYFALLQILAQMDDNELYGFDYQCKKLQHKAHLSKLWACAHIAMGGCSADSFEYFKMWLLARGRHVYEAALADPDTLYDELLNLETMEEVCEFEAMACAAIQTYCARQVKNDDETMNFYLDNFEVLGGFSHDLLDINIDWNANKPETLRIHCPRVFDYFWKIPLGYT
jgi:Protein of unknown function (DUF4240)